MNFVVTVALHAGEALYPGEPGAVADHILGYMAGLLITSVTGIAGGRAAVQSHPPSPGHKSTDPGEAGSKLSILFHAYQKNANTLA